MSTAIAQVQSQALTSCVLAKEVMAVLQTGGCVQAWLSCTRPARVLKGLVRTFIVTQKQR